MFVCYVSVSIGSVFCVCSVSWSIVPVCLCSLLCLLGVPSVFCVCSTVCLCVAPFSLCVLFMCVLYVWRVSIVGLCVCACFLLTVSVCLLCLCSLVCVLRVYYVCVCLCLCLMCMCLLFLCVYVVYVSTVFYVYCICYVYVCFSVLCLCCWLPCWCGVYHGGVMGACFLGLVVLVFWGVWRVWNFFIFYSRFGVGGRLLLGFCYRTFFCGFPWGLCHTRNFFKDITHSYCGYVIPVMSLCMCLLAYLYRTPRYCADIAPVYTCAPCLPLPVFVSACVYVTPVFHSMLPRYCAYSTPCLASTYACIMF